MEHHDHRPAGHADRCVERSWRCIQRHAYPASVSITGSGESNSPAASLGGVKPTLNYYDGSNTTGTSLGGTAPAAVGTYTVVAAYAGSADYVGVRSAPVTFTIKAATATIATITLAASKRDSLRPGSYFRRDGGGPGPSSEPSLSLTATRCWRRFRSTRAARPR